MKWGRDQKFPNVCPISVETPCEEISSANWHYNADHIQASPDSLTTLVTVKKHLLSNQLELNQTQH